MVVIASVVRNRSSLTIGNIVGSTIFNILSVFSLGLLFHSTSQKIVFDRSSKIYSLLLLILTFFVTLLSFLGARGSWKIVGGVLLTLFVIYVASVTWTISRGTITASELSDSNDDDNSDESDSDSEEKPHPNDVIESETRSSQDAEAISVTLPADIALDASPVRRELQHRPLHRRRRSLKYHIAFLLLEFISICLFDYVLSHASIIISDEIEVSHVLFEVVILSIATILSENFIVVLSEVREHVGILIANTVESNIFLLTLCMRIVLVVTAKEFNTEFVNAVELKVIMGSMIALTTIVWFDTNWSRWIERAMLMTYITFLVLEFSLIRKV